MSSKKPIPLPYHHKPPMRFKNFEIHYNSDHTLTKIQTNRHDYFEFYFLLSGAINFFVEGVKYNLDPGDILLIAPKQEHHSVITGSAPYVRYVLWLDPGYVSSLSSPATNLPLAFQKNPATNSHIKPDADMRDRIHHLLDSLLIASQSKGYGADLLTTAYMVELLVTLAQFRLFSQSSYPLDAFNATSKPIVKNTLNYINQHIYDPINVQEIADAMFVSRSYLSRVFSEEMSIPLHQFITKKKLFLAKRELSAGIALRDVVAKYSFGNYSSFFRAFKQEFGTSPKQMQTGIRPSEHPGADA